MSSISNRFYVTALQDGTTLHGNLVSTVPLVQTWNGVSASPDWTDPSEQPIIYLTLLDGSTLVAPDAGDWYYNNHGTSQKILPNDPTFEITTYTIENYMGQTGSVTVPALKIKGNLAQTGNTDVDIITYKSTYSGGGGAIPFSADAQIRISSASKGSSLGLIYFVNGKSDIVSVNDSVKAYARAFNGDTGADIDGFTVKWYINDEEILSGDSRLGTETVGNKTFPALTINQEDVVDHAIIRCDFFSGGNKIAVDFAGVDDMQDPQFMYIQLNKNNSNSASLRVGDYADFKIWVGTRDNANVLKDSNNNVAFNFIYVTLLDSEGTIVTRGGLSIAIPNVANGNLEDGQAGYGCRALVMTDGKGSLTPDYETVSTLGKNMTGILTAYSQRPSWHPVQP